MRISIILSYLFFILLLFNSCELSKPDEEKLSDRTLLVYIGRDNNLSGSFEDKRDAIIEGWNGRGGTLVIYQDLPSGAKLEVITKKKQDIQSRILYEKETENSADSRVFAEVIRQTLVACPAKSYGLVVFSHASGWLPEATLTAPRSIVQDRDSWMNLPDFANAIPNNLFDFIVFEACFMGTIEVAYELKEKADYILFSPAEILSPGFKEIYKTSVNKLFLSEPDLRSFMDDAFLLLGEEGFKSATFSIVRTAELDRLADWVRRNTKYAEFPSIAEMQVFDRYSYHLFFDFGQHISRLRTTSADLTDFSAILNSCVVHKINTPSFLLLYNGFTITHYSGLATYIPQERFPYLNEVYQNTKWAQAIRK